MLEKQETPAAGTDSFDRIHVEVPYVHFAFTLRPLVLDGALKGNLRPKASGKIVADEIHVRVKTEVMAPKLDDSPVGGDFIPASSPVKSKRQKLKNRGWAAERRHQKQATNATAFEWGKNE
jgi:hypothetical protein